MMRHILSLTLVMLFSSFLPIQAADPEGRLFRFERSTNRNYICYDVNLVDGKLNTKDPIHVYWIRVEEGGGQKELTFIQRKLAFGYKVIRQGQNEAYIHLTAYRPLEIRICQRGGKWMATANIDGKEAQLDRLFAQMRSPNSLHVEYVDLFGRSLANGKSVTERIRQ